MRLYKKHQEGGIFNIPGDKTYDYKTEGDKYFTKKKDSTNWIELNEKTLKSPEVYKEVVTTLKQYAPQSVEKKDSTESKQKNNSTEEILITNFDSIYDYKIVGDKYYTKPKTSKSDKWIDISQNKTAVDLLNKFRPDMKWTNAVSKRYNNSLLNDPDFKAAKTKYNITKQDYYNLKDRYESAKKGDDVEWNEAFGSKPITFMGFLTALKTL